MLARHHDKINDSWHNVVEHTHDLSTDTITSDFDDNFQTWCVTQENEVPINSILILKKIFNIFKFLNVLKQIEILKRWHH